MLKKPQNPVGSGLRELARLELPDLGWEMIHAIMYETEAELWELWNWWIYPVQR